MVAIKSVAAATNGAPSQANSKKPNVGAPAAVSVSATTMLGGEPISVISPPRLAAIASGIRKRDGAIPSFHAAAINAGSRTATV